MTYRSQMDRVTPGVADLDPATSQKYGMWDYGPGGWDSGERVNYFADQLPGNWVRNWDEKGKYQGDYEQKDDPVFNGLTALTLAAITAGAINPAMFSGAAAAGGGAGSGAFLGEGVASGVGAWDAAAGMGLAEAGGTGLSALAPTAVGSSGTVAGVTAGGGSGLLAPAYTTAAADSALASQAMGFGAADVAAGAGVSAAVPYGVQAAGASLIPGIANSTLAQIAAAGTGLLASGDGEKTSKNDPWGPAQPYILDNLKSGKKLQDFYQQNPFNQAQKTSYQNTFGDLDNFRQNVAPGLMDFANRGMNSNYQRQRGGEAGDGAGYGGPVRQGGLLQSGQGPFSVNRGQSYGLLDFDAMNPFRK